jgi:hypothetical protein
MSDLKCILYVTGSFRAFIFIFILKNKTIYGMGGIPPPGAHPHGKSDNFPNCSLNPFPSLSQFIGGMFASPSARHPGGCCCASCIPMVVKINTRRERVISMWFLYIHVP